MPFKATIITKHTEIIYILKEMMKMLLKGYTIETRTFDVTRDLNQ